jgi:uncharacterized membrane protein
MQTELETKQPTQQPWSVSTTTPRADWLSVTLPRAADLCYELFCDVERIPQWLTVVRSAIVVDRDHLGRPREVSFQASLHRATIGYTCRYRYHLKDRRVAWSTRDDTKLRIRGFAQFQPLGETACLMTYALDVDLGSLLPTWTDPQFNEHAPSSALADFRDFVSRMI